MLHQDITDRIICCFCCEILIRRYQKLSEEIRVERLDF